LAHDTGGISYEIAVPVVNFGFTVGSSIKNGLLGFFGDLGFVKDPLVTNVELQIAHEEYLEKEEDYRKKREAEKKKKSWY